MQRDVRKLALTWLLTCVAATTARAGGPEPGPAWLEASATRITFDADPSADARVHLDDFRPLAATIDLKAALAPRRALSGLDLDRRWSLGVRGDTGGYSLFGGVHCRLSYNCGLYLGYRGSRLDPFHRWSDGDLRRHGVFIGLRLKF